MQNAKSENHYHDAEQFSEQIKLERIEQHLFRLQTEIVKFLNDLMSIRNPQPSMPLWLQSKFEQMELAILSLPEDRFPIIHRWRTTFFDLYDRFMKMNERKLLQLNLNQLRSKSSVSKIETQGRQFLSSTSEPTITHLKNIEKNVAIQHNSNTTTLITTFQIKTNSISTLAQVSDFRAEKLAIIRQEQLKLQKLQQQFENKQKTAMISNVNQDFGRLNSQPIPNFDDYAEILRYIEFLFGRLEPFTHPSDWESLKCLIIVVARAEKILSTCLIQSIDDDHLRQLHLRAISLAWEWVPIAHRQHYNGPRVDGMPQSLREINKFLKQKLGRNNCCYNNNEHHSRRNQGSKLINRRIVGSDRSVTSKSGPELSLTATTTTTTTSSRKSRQHIVASSNPATVNTIHNESMFIQSMMRQNLRECATGKPLCFRCFQLGHSVQRCYNTPLFPGQSRSTRSAK